MIEGVCESRSGALGRATLPDAASVLPSPLRPPYWPPTSAPTAGCGAPVPRTVRVTLTDGTLYASGLLGEPVRLVPQSDTFFHG